MAGDSPAGRDHDGDLVHLAAAVALAFHKHLPPGPDFLFADGGSTSNADELETVAGRNWEDVPASYRKGLYLTIYQLLDERIIEIGPEIMAAETEATAGVA